MIDQIVHHALGSLLRKLLIVILGSTVISVGRQFDGDIRILIEHQYERVEGVLALRQESNLVEGIEDIVDKHRR